MEKTPQDSRRSAAHEFTSSLDELKVTLQSEDIGIAPQGQADVDPALLNKSRLSRETDLETWFEEAVQDIDRFMSERPETP
ncbi:MAG: hypothetical protein F6J95_009400 [Leptolyngbya sp. SIO1E4]|nr:hypothetical protein [Leptolyngbya sp. SIO1E4]